MELATLRTGEHGYRKVQDLLTGAHYLWHGPGKYVELNPGNIPAHVFRLRRHVRSEQDREDFD